MCIVNYLGGLAQAPLPPHQVDKLAGALQSLLGPQNPSAVRQAGLDALSRLWGYLDEQTAGVSGPEH